jgi:hypothetical protein
VGSRETVRLGVRGVSGRVVEVDMGDVQRAHSVADRETVARSVDDLEAFGE